MEGGVVESGAEEELCAMMWLSGGTGILGGLWLISILGGVKGEMRHTPEGCGLTAGSMLHWAGAGLQASQFWCPYDLMTEALLHIHWRNSTGFKTSLFVLEIMLDWRADGDIKQLVRAVPRAHSLTILRQAKNYHEIPSAGFILVPLTSSNRRYRDAGTSLWRTKAS